MKKDPWRELCCAVIERAKDDYIFICTNEQGDRPIHKWKPMVADGISAEEYLFSDDSDLYFQYTGMNKSEFAEMVEAKIEGFRKY